MSKTDLSLRLLAILRFTIPSNSSRTLNATQAYDVTSSGITLASAIGTLLDKDVAVKAEAAVPLPTQVVGVGLTVKTTATVYPFELGAEKAAVNPLLVTGNTVALTVVANKNLGNGAKKKRLVAPTCPGYPNCTISTANFQGTASGRLIEGPVLNNSKATNPNTIFYGGIPVGTGEYKKWQGNYAVLKINTSTGKCVLRIYDA